MADIEHKETSEKNIKAAMSFLKDALKCIGITSAPKLDLSFAGSTAFIFSFSGVTCEATDPVNLDFVVQKLSTGAIPDEYVNAGRLHIAYEYLYAESLLMGRSDRAAFEHDVTGIKIADYIDIGTSGKVEAESSTVIKFQNAGQRAAFAYKAGRLEKNDGKWEFYPEEVGGRRAFKAAELGRKYLPARGVALPVYDELPVLSKE